nr:hypothetical protein [Micromonospora sp. DSM 115978]
MDAVDAGEAARVAASLAGRLDRLTFTDLTADEVTARIIDAAVEWAADQGWRVYRRATSVMPLPPPMSARHSIVDVACARRGGSPVVIEVDRTDRARTVEKLAAEAAAGRVALWVRWGAGPFAVPPPPVRLVTCEVARRPGPGRRYAREPERGDRPAPTHSGAAATAPAVELPIPFPGPGPTGQGRTAGTAG